jgi:hydrogenase nickel incorporation protein HypA/HybF
MHELSIALCIIDVASEEALRHHAARVVAVHLKLGPLAGVVREALESAFELAREGSPLAEACLVIEETPIVLHCATCGADRAAVSVQNLCCAQCGTPSMEIVRGRDLEVAALEIEA